VNDTLLIATGRVVIQTRWSERVSVSSRRFLPIQEKRRHPG